MDLWEGKNNYPYLNIPYTNEPIDDQVQRALNKLNIIDPILYQRVFADLVFVSSHENINILPSNVDIQRPADAFNKYVKAGCPLEGMMFFDNAIYKLSIKNEIYSKLINNTNVAAARVHEAIYKTFRESLDHKDSRKTRLLTACLFSNDNCLGLDDERWQPPKNQKVMLCQSPSMDVYIYKEFVTMDINSPNQYGGTMGAHIKWAARVTRVGTNTFQIPLQSTGYTQLYRNNPDEVAYYGGFYNLVSPDLYDLIEYSSLGENNNGSYPYLRLFNEIIKYIPTTVSGRQNSNKVRIKNLQALNDFWPQEIVISPMKIPAKGSIKDPYIFPEQDEIAKCKFIN